MSAKIKIKINALHKICKKYGIESDAQLAKILEMDRGSIYRAKKLGIVGSEFVAKAIIKLKIQFNDLFEAKIEE